MSLLGARGEAGAQPGCSTGTPVLLWSGSSQGWGPGRQGSWTKAGPAAPTLSASTEDRLRAQCAVCAVSRTDRPTRGCTRWDGRPRASRGRGVELIEKLSLSLRVTNVCMLEISPSSTHSYVTCG